MSPLTVTSANSDCPAPPMPGSPEAPAAVVTPPQISSEQILNLLPHRYPFALVDRVVDYQPGHSAVAIKNRPRYPQTPGLRRHRAAAR